MGQFDHRHLIQPQLASGGKTPVPCDDAVVAVDQDRIRPAVLDDAGRDLGDLALGVRARIAGVGYQRLDLAVLDVERVQSGFPKNETRRALPLDGLVHHETYHDYDDQRIAEIYDQREFKGWQRYMTFPELRRKVEESGVENLAQLYTTVKYTRDSHQEYSRRVLDYLAAQDFFNNGQPG